MTTENKNNVIVKETVIANGVKQSANKKEIASAKKLRNDVRVPKLRFKEFEDDWEETTLGDLFTFKNGLNSDKEKYGSGIKFINVLDIIEEAVITYDSIFGKVEVTDKELEKNEVIYGDVLFQRSSETRKEVGQANVYVDKNKSAVFGGFVIRGRKKVDYNPYFINYLLKTSSARKEVTTKSGGSTRYNVGQDSLSEVLIKLTTLKEQQKIATFLTAVDTKIQQLGQKKELLANYKKGVMQQLFSQQLRFKPDSQESLRGTKQSKAISTSVSTQNSFPDWVEKRLGDICKVNPKNSQLPNSFIYINLESVNKGRLVLQNKISLEEAPSRAQRVLEVNDILFQTVRPYQMNNLYFEEKGNYIASTGYAQLRTKESSMFLYQLLHTNQFVNNVLERCTGTSYPAINSNDLAKIKIKIPSLKEQQKIATYLSAIDEKITTIQTQIEKTQAFKKGLLQQMFV